MIFIKNLLLILILAITPGQSVMLNSAGKQVCKIIKNEAFPPEQIEEFVKILKETKGTKKLGNILGKKHLKNEVLEDTFMRIAIHQNKISKAEAEEMFMNLCGTSGFRTTLRKVVGNSAQKTSGHLNELKIANNASINGFKVRGIGVKFSDGIKKAPTDLDIVLTRKGKTFVIEAKDYAPTTQLRLDSFRGDMDTLISYAKQNPNEYVIPVFSMTNKPSSAIKLKQLEKISEKRGVQLIFGSPQAQIEKIKLLGDIL